MKVFCVVYENQSRFDVIIADLVFTRMKELRLTQSGLARRLKWDRANLSHLLHRKGGVVAQPHWTMGKLMQVANAMNFQVEVLFNVWDD